jgi:hypothetical protein
MAKVFYYIATNDEQAARDLCEKYGYECYDIDDVSAALMEISTSDDEGFKDVMSLHPEKNLLVEMFSGNKGFNSSHKESNKGCKRCKLDGMLVHTNQADGTTATAAPVTAPVSQSQTLTALLQTNTFLVIGIVAMIGAAIMIYNKN